MALTPLPAGVHPQQLAGAPAQAPENKPDTESISPLEAVGKIATGVASAPGAAASAAAGSITSSIGAAVLGPITEVAVTVVLAAAGVVLIVLAVARLADAGAAKALGSQNAQTALTVVGAVKGGK